KESIPSSTLSSCWQTCTWRVSLPVQCWAWGAEKHGPARVAECSSSCRGGWPARAHPGQPGHSPGAALERGYRETPAADTAGVLDLRRLHLVHQPLLRPALHVRARLAAGSLAAGRRRQRLYRSLLGRPCGDSVCLL